MRDFETIIQLIDKLDQSSVAFLDVTIDQHHIVLSKEVPTLSTMTQPVSLQQEVVPQPSSLGATATPEPVEVVEQVPTPTGELVKAPLVGVVYLQPQPDAATYVSIGDKVNKGDVLCLVEAMKLMNDIQAPCSGVITEILVDNESVVEYDQPLFRIQP